MTPMGHPSHDQPPEEPTEAELADRFRRWFVCPVVGCGVIEEYDARIQTAHFCPSETHPSTTLRVLFNDRLIRHA